MPERSKILQYTPWSNEDAEKLREKMEETLFDKWKMSMQNQENTMKIRCASCLNFRTQACKEKVKWDDTACENHEKNHWLGRIMP
ncbi:hypothetical protein EZS27_004719 [termite gut metagenome]|uniref:Uncharacterized protein n=1 Tax=termite gut metagenome TaxID=433724 RepID=A0A5J4SNW2_9ZZZZ